MLRRLALSLGLVVSLCGASQAQILCHAENDGPNYDDGAGIVNAWFGIEVTPTASFAVQRIEIFTGEVNAASALDIWANDSSSGLPLAALSTDAFTIQMPNGWQGVNLATPTPLIAGTTYWVVWRAVAGAQPSLDLPMAVNGQPTAVSLDSGASWNGPIVSPNRHWKFRLYGDCCAAATVYCTAGTSANGCQALLSFAGVADANAGSGFVVTANTVEGQKQGLLFYGLSGPAATPWGVGGTSFLCVSPPTQRTPVQSSGGAIGVCDGSLSVDWNAFIAGNPGALGNPFSGGETVWMQAWYRDPPSVKTTSLSDALQFGVCP